MAADSKSGLTPKQQRFVDEYVVDYNGKQAAIRAEYSVRTAEVQASRLLSNAKVQEAIAAKQKRLSEKLEIDAERVLSELWSIATGDANDIVEHRRVCCRHCHGTNFKYQYTASELESARAAHKERAAKAEEDGKGGIAPFDPKGGDGFHALRDPHPDCPECFGEGVSRVFVKDTRKLSPTARALFAGIKETRDGIEVKTHSKMDALDRLCKHLGLFAPERHEHTGKGGEPIRVQTGPDLTGLSREDLDALEQILAKGSSDPPAG